MSRIDPRVRRTLDDVRSAAVVELGEKGWGGFTVEGVAARAGVARSTVYRHWPDRRALLVDALEHHSTQPPVVAGVEALVLHLAERMADPTASAFAIALADAGEREPDLKVLQQRFADQRRAGLVAALRAEGHPDPELAAVALAGAVVYRRAMEARPMAPDEVRRLVALVNPTSP